MRELLQRLCAALFFRKSTPRRDKFRESHSEAPATKLRMEEMMGTRRSLSLRREANAIRFQKYRVAPRLGTDTVRRRLLAGLDHLATWTAAETELA
jgi:hypothetical protein